MTTSDPGDDEPVILFPAEVLAATQVITLDRAPSDWRDDPRFVYIGRSGRGLVSVWGNRHPVWRPCRACRKRHQRGEALRLHRAETERRYAIDAAFRAQVDALYGKFLICFCGAGRCHGDVLAELAERAATARKIG